MCRVASQPVQKLSNIQVLRGLAALAVVVFHAREEIDGLGLPTHLPAFFPGAFGVDLFFVVSGVVMVYSSAPLFGSPRSALPFMGRRLARIVPLYWAVTAAFVLLDPADARGDLGRGAFARFVALSLAFVPYAVPANDDASPVYPLGWTLDYEMAFYVCFALALALPRRRAVAALAVALSALVVLHLTIALPGWLAYLGSSQILEFVAGLLVAEAALAGWRLRGPVAVAVAACGLAAALAASPFSDAWWGLWRGLVWGMPAAAIVGAAALYRVGSRAGRLRRAFEKLGDASYALYLVHYGVFIAAEAVLVRIAGPVRLPAALVMTGLIALAVAAGFVVHRAFEVPATRWLHRRLAPGRRPAAALSGR